MDVLLFDDVMTRLAGRRPYRVLITGLLHAGKSTLVNSLLRIQNNDWRDEMPTPCMAGTGGIAGRAGPAGDGVAAQDDMSMTTRLTRLSARRGTCAVDLIDSPHVWHGADDELMFRIVNGLPYNTELLEGAWRSFGLPSVQWKLVKVAFGIWIVHVGLAGGVPVAGVPDAPENSIDAIILVVRLSKLFEPAQAGVVTYASKVQAVCGLLRRVGTEHCQCLTGREPANVSTLVSTV